MSADSKSLRKTLKKFGLSDHAISAAWPGWWSYEADGSSSARNELRFSVARKLGLDPRSLLENDEPRFVWRDEAKFKHFSGENNFESAALTSFGVSLGRALIQATPGNDIPNNLNAKSIRNSILSYNPYVSLKDLMTLCWALGIPIIQLKVFPLSSKLMCAMAVNIEGRFAILMGRESSFPAQLAYYVAHELGHILLGHLESSVAVVEFDDILKSPGDNGDKEEQAADKFALELLTGQAEPLIVTDAKKFVAQALADAVMAASAELHIEPGTLALCLGHSTNLWEKVYASMKYIYDIKEPLWKTLNDTALTQMDFSLLSDELSSFVTAVMGANKK